MQHVTGTSPHDMRSSHDMEMLAAVCVAAMWASQPASQPASQHACMHACMHAEAFHAALLLSQQAITSVAKWQGASSCSCMPKPCATSGTVLRAAAAAAPAASSHPPMCLCAPARYLASRAGLPKKALSQEAAWSPSSAQAPLHSHTVVSLQAVAGQLE